MADVNDTVYWVEQEWCHRTTYSVREGKLVSKGGSHSCVLTEAAVNPLRFIPNCDIFDDFRDAKSRQSALEDK